MTKKADWKGYNDGKSMAPPRPRLLHTLDTYFPAKTGHALDLGCGSGRDINELLNRGWRVDGVDSDGQSLESAREIFAKHLDCLTLIESSFEALTLFQKKYDLVNASYSLPFCPRDHFPNFWGKIISSLKVGGYLTCELFGVRDSWNSIDPEKGERTFLTKEKVQEYLVPFDIIELEELEFDKPSFNGPEKHWHVFQCIARKVEP